MSASRGMSLSLQDQTVSSKLRLYAALAGAIRLSYRNKIMLIAFIGTHVPLLALVAWYATATATSLAEALRVIGVALVATLVGTGITLTVLNHLLRPILMTAQALRRYATDRRLPSLPVGFTDEAGQLMSDTVGTLTRLDAVLEDLAYVDTVTGLANRDRMLHRLAERLAAGDRLALCVVALRNADQVTAGFGEAGVNIALRLLATRLDAAAGYGAIIARLEGRRFAVVLDAGQPEPGLVARLEAVLAFLRPEISHGEMTLLPDLAVGVALAPEDATEAEALLNAAQAAVPTGLQLAPAFYSAAAQAASIWSGSCAAPWIGTS
jgi:GGDEF domain-containing protein